MHLTEEEWIARYNQSIPSTLMVAGSIADDEEFAPSPEEVETGPTSTIDIIFDSGATVTVDGEKWLKLRGCGVSELAMQKKSPTKRFRFGDSRASPFLGFITIGVTSATVGDMGTRNIRYDIRT